MKETTFFVFFSSLAAVSLASGLIGWQITKRIEAGYKHVKSSSFREVYEDNESDDFGDLFE